MLQLGSWYTVKDGDVRVVSLYERHYSANPKTSRSARIHYGIAGPSEKMVLLTAEANASFIWTHPLIDRLDKQAGVNCSFFRNEGPLRSSDLIREASEMAWQRWPGERLWTYVNPKLIRSSNPGYCFIKAGWTRLENRSGKGLVILEKLP